MIVVVLVLENTTVDYLYSMVSPPSPASTTPGKSKGRNKSPSTESQHVRLFEELRRMPHICDPAYAQRLHPICTIVVSIFFSTIRSIYIYIHTYLSICFFIYLSYRYNRYHILNPAHQEAVAQTLPSIPAQPRSQASGVPDEALPLL